MNFLLSAKGGDVTTWRAVENFAAAYRQALLDRAVSDRSDSVEAVFSKTCFSVEDLITTHRDLLERLESQIKEVSVTPSDLLPPPNGISALTKSFPAEKSQEMTSNLLKELTVAFYSDLYRHFDSFHSPPAFYQLSMAFLQQMSAAIITQVIDKLGLHGFLPEMALIAVGPAGRCEYSPFSPLQILIVHGEVAESRLQSIDLFCYALHAGFEAAGIPVDPAVTPRGARWRGTLSEWQQRFEDGLHPKADEELMDLCRLVDQYPLYSSEQFARELKQISSTVLSGSRLVLTNLIERMVSLSNGLGLMGRLKLERGGSERGLFRLLDHGLLPLSAALSTLALIKKSAAAGNCERIHDLLRRGELDVEQAERMLATWHYLNGLRLRLEQSSHIGVDSNPASFLNPEELTVDQRQALKDALESVAVIQRHVEIIFSGMGE